MTIDHRRYATSILSMDATNFPILARSIPSSRSSPSLSILVDDCRSDYPAERRTRHIIDDRALSSAAVVDSSSGNQETAVAPRGNRNRVWKYERNAEGRKEDKDKEDKTQASRLTGGKKEKRGLRLIRGERIMRSERKTWIQLQKRKRKEKKRKNIH